MTRIFALLPRPNTQIPVDPAPSPNSVGRMNHSPYDRTIAEAARQPEAWRLLAGILTVIGGFGLWTLGLVALRAAWTSAGLVDTGADMFQPGLERPVQTVFFLTVVAGLGVATLAAARLWHGRGLASLAGPGARTLRHAAVAAAAAFSVLGLSTVASLYFYGLPVRNLDVVNWLTWFPLGLLVIALQTGAEELFFRGYLQSQLAARFGSSHLAIGGPALLFGLLHFVPTLPLVAGLTYVLIAAMFAFLAADLTIRTGSLGAAWGFHFANNALTVLFVTPTASLSGLALWQSPPGAGIDALTTPLATVEIVVLVLIWALIRRVLRL